MVAALDAAGPTKQAQVWQRQTTAPARKSEDVLLKGVGGLRGQGNAGSIDALRTRTDLPVSMSGGEATTVMNGGMAAEVVDQSKWRAELTATRDRLVASLLPYASYEDVLDEMPQPSGFGGAGSEVQQHELEFVSAVEIAMETLNSLLAKFAAGASTRVELLGWGESNTQHDVRKTEEEMAEQRYAEELIRGGPEISLSELRMGLEEVARKLRGAYRKGTINFRERLDATRRLESENLSLTSCNDALELQIVEMGTEHEALQEQLRSAKARELVATGRETKALKTLSLIEAEVRQARGETETQRLRAEDAERSVQAGRLQWATELDEAVNKARAEDEKSRAEMAALQAAEGKGVAAMAGAAAVEAATAAAAAVAQACAAREAAEAQLVEMNEAKIALEEENQRLTDELEAALRDAEEGGAEMEARAVKSRATQASALAVKAATRAAEEEARAKAEEKRAATLETEVEEMRAAAQDAGSKLATAQSELARERALVEAVGAEKRAAEAALAKADKALQDARAALEQQLLASAAAAAAIAAAVAEPVTVADPELSRRLALLEEELRESNARADEAVESASVLKEQVAAARAQAAEAREQVEVGVRG